MSKSKAEKWIAGTWPIKVRWVNGLAGLDVCSPDNYYCRIARARLGMLHNQGITDPDIRLIDRPPRIFANLLSALEGLQGGITPERLAAVTAVTEKIKAVRAGLIEGRANARLIAAVPMMRKALDGLQEGITPERLEAAKWAVAFALERGKRLYSPGMWRVKTIREDATFFTIETQRGDRHFYDVATVPRVAVFGTLTESQAERNEALKLANLIATAPAMLEALEGLLKDAPPEPLAAVRMGLKAI